MADQHRSQASRLARMLAVCSALLLRGQQRLLEVEKSSGLALDKLKPALLVLLQHSLVDAYKSGERRSWASRKPYVLRRIQRDFADQGKTVAGATAQITKALLEHGRLRWDQLLHIVAEQQQGEELAQVVEDGFRQLLASQLVERAPPCDLPPPIEKVHSTAVKTKKAPQQGSIEETRMMADMAVALAHTTYRNGRFDSPNFAEQPSDPAPGAKRKRGADGQAPVLWRLNYGEFTRRSRCDQCVRVVGELHGEDAAQVVAGLFRAGNGHAHEAAEGESPALTANDIAATTSGNYTFPTWDRNMVYKQLRKLESADPALMRSESEQGVAHVKFSLRMDHALELIQNQLMDKIVLDRHGVVGLRIFRLLKDKKQLEQKQVADLSVLPPKDAREALYSLFQDGFVAFQDIPKLPDHAASRTFFTWYVNRAAVVAKLVSDWLKAAGNIRARLAHVFNEHSQVLNLLMGPGAEAASKQLTPAQRTAVATYRQAKLVGEGRFVALDPYFALFMD